MPEVTEIYNEAFMEHSPSFQPELKLMDIDYHFSSKEIDILRRLAFEVAEIAQRPEMQKKKELWKDHNDLKSDQPLIYVSPEVGWNEIITPQSLECTDPLARTWEVTLKKKIYTANEIKDDQIIENRFDVPYSYTTDGWGIDIVRTGAEGVAAGGAFHIEAVLEDYERDFEKLHFPTIEIDWVESNRVLQLAENTFGDILNVKHYMLWQSDVSSVDKYVLLRGMEEFMMDFILHPEYIHKMMRLMTDGMMKRLDWLEENSLLFLNNDSSYIGTGGQGWTRDLPDKDFSGQVTTKDMWGLAQAQETVSISPDMYAEFILPYHIELMERFGLAYYGCCEPTDVRWEHVKKIPNLRRVSWSPWANTAKAPELLGKDYVACIKPNPTPLASSIFDEDALREECREIVQSSKGAICEFLMKDNHTLGGEGRRLIRWVEIMREEIDRAY